GQRPEDGAYMPHLWCVERYRHIVDFAPFARERSEFLFDYVTEMRRPDEYAELSQLIIQPQNQTICQWHEEVKILRQTEGFRETVENHIVACREIAFATSQIQQRLSDGPVLTSPEEFTKFATGVSASDGVSLEVPA